MTLWKHNLTICSRCSFLFHTARCALLDPFCKTKASSSDFARHLSFLALPETIRLKLKGLWKVAVIGSELQVDSVACSYPVSTSENRMLRFKASGEVNILLQAKITLFRQKSHGIDGSRAYANCQICWDVVRIHVSHYTDLNR